MPSKFVYVQEEWMNAVPNKAALTEQDTLYLSTLNAVVPVDRVCGHGKSIERVFSDWLDAGRKAGVVTGGEANRLWKAYAAGTA